MDNLDDNLIAVSRRVYKDRITCSFLEGIVAGLIFSLLTLGLAAAACWGYAWAHN